MRKITLMLLLLPLMFAFWVVIFEAIDSHMETYQECGGVYCKMDETSEECHNCRHWFYQYYTDTGQETSCALLDSGSGIATDCPAFDRMKDERENQNDPL
jgi:hypothetical protein